MFPLLRRAHGFRTPSLCYISRLIDHYLPMKSETLTRSVHAQLIKLGLIRNTFLGNRCLELYFKSGSITDASSVFDDIPDKNTISWNVCLKGLLDSGNLDDALSVFGEMPERDVVTWNTMIRGLASYGFSDCAMKIFSDMQNRGVRVSEFTFSIVTTLAFCARHGKQIHGNMIRRGVSRSNLVVWNSLIDMYGKLGPVEYAFGVFRTMEDLDNISWNSLILCCSASGNEELGLNQFFLMMTMGYEPDEYTVSIILSICSDLQDLVKGKQVFALCIKMGFLSNTIVSGAAIDMFSKCNRLVDSVQLFEELENWDPALCNSIIASYSFHGFAEEALRVFVLALRQNIMPDGFTISSVLSSISLVMLDHGKQVHSLTIKLGIESDTTVATSLMEMYNKNGLVGSAIEIFAATDSRDLISWNTMIVGLARNSRATKCLGIFPHFLKQGLKPDQVTFTSMLLACCEAGFVSEGVRIFSSMEKYGIGINDEHYACLVDLLCRGCMISEAIDIAQNMPFEPSSRVWEIILTACLNLGDLFLAEAVAERMLESEPESLFPYQVLANIYETNWQWEELVRIRYAMEKSGLKLVLDSSKIGVKNKVYTFDAGQIQIHGSHETYAILTLLIWDSEYQNAQCFAEDEEKEHFFVE
ncbi:PREDICTED: pentatricopeptide repeat-containing protein At1g43980, mitochondrial isoform X2 [Tarenaya hassleriana]|nr:PREDICTED: pentatricopeptide repeat-containing protein At1g43980, mitochondrial isoform X2 [Tarenaya hassleriana]